MVIDIFTYNGEADLLELRLNILNAHVDQFILVEAPTTFSGKPKPLYFREQSERFKKWNIKYFIIDENYSKEELALAESSPNTKGAGHWKHEFLQKESIKKALMGLHDDDICFIGDVDEIWNPKVPNLSPEKLRLRVYSYYLNNASSETFWGTLIAPYWMVKESCLNHLRTDQRFKGTTFSGWHFTSMGGISEMRRKLTDSYTEETYATDSVLARLEDNIRENRDFLGRGFTYGTDESNWPEYLKDNREKYKHMLK